MNLQANNLISTASQKAPRPDTNLTRTNKEEQQDVNLDKSRKIGEELGAEDIQTPNQEDKAVQALTTVANFGRKIGSKALNFSGFIGITVAALSYIMFRFKLLSAAIAAPALGAFYIANTMKKAAKESEKNLGTLSNPKDIITKAKEDSTYLEEHFKKVVAAMVKIGEMKDTDPNKEEALQDLRQVARKVAAKRTELNKVNKKSNELLKIKHFMDIYDSVKKDRNQSETEIEHEQEQALAA